MFNVQFHFTIITWALNTGNIAENWATQSYDKNSHTYGLKNYEGTSILHYNSFTCCYLAIGSNAWRNKAFKIK